MSWSGNVPGVYRQEVTLRADPKLRTGIAGFVGFADVTDPTTADSPVVALRRWDEFTARIKGAKVGYLADAVAGFFQNGGSLCYVACAQLSTPLDATTSNNQNVQALLTALELLAPLTEVDLVAMPDAMMFYWPGDKEKLKLIQRLQIALLQHCEMTFGRLAIVDALPVDTKATITQRHEITGDVREPVNGALYYPWIKTYNGRLVPPCGHVAGIYARSDGRAGVFKAPANEEILGAVDLGILVKKIDSEKDVLSTHAVEPDQAALNPEGVNCLRAFPGRGIRVWGARTLSTDPTWRYINVRRLFLSLQRWIELNMGWVSFEPNTPQLWIGITREITAYLNTLWNTGGLAGKTAEQAFYVKCDAETSPAEAREAGQVITEIGLAPALPSEFVVVRIIHHTAVEPR